jgi:hypothetical protein
MTFTGDLLRTENKLLLRLEGVTTDSLLQFRVLSGFNWAYGLMREPISTEEILLFESSATLTDLIKQKNDIVHLFGKFDILTDYKTNIISLNCVYYFESFCWATMPGKLVLNE